MSLLKSERSLFLVGEFQDAVHVIGELASLARVLGYVDESFAGNVLKREQEYPTGLPMGIPIAIPHVSEGCLESFFAMAVLQKPVSFFNMGDSNEELMVRIVFLFGITNPSKQTEVLKKFMRTFRQKEVLQDLLESVSSEELAKKIGNVLGDMVCID